MAGLCVVFVFCRDCAYQFNLYFLCVCDYHRALLTHHIISTVVIFVFSSAVCTEAGMYALRERRVHVTQEDFEMAVAKVMKKDTDKNMSLKKLWK